MSEVIIKILEDLTGWDSSVNKVLWTACEINYITFNLQLILVADNKGEWHIY